MDNISKYAIVCCDGKFIGTRFYYNYNINLYLFEDAFYEIWYFKPTNKIEKIEVLDDDKKLDLYIDYMQKNGKSRLVKTDIYDSV